MSGWRVVGEWLVLEIFITGMGVRAGCRARGKLGGNALAGSATCGAMGRDVMQKVKHTDAVCVPQPALCVTCCCYPGVCDSVFAPVQIGYRLIPVGLYSRQTHETYRKGDPGGRAN